jgi:hypothetical protein
MAGRMGRDYDAAQGAISQRRYLSLCSCNAQRAASWGIGLFAIFAAILSQRTVLLLFLSFCVGLIPRKIKSTQNDEEPQKEGRKRRHHLRVPVFPVSDKKSTLRGLGMYAGDVVK